MQYRALESEVKSLDAEVTRLRIMVNRCVEAQDAWQDERLRMAKLRRQQDLDAVYSSKQGNVAGVSARDQQATLAFGEVNREALATALANNHRLPLPTDPMSVLPSIFSGMDGTARLFKVLIETYPWLVPPELQEAQASLLEKQKDRKRSKALERELFKSKRKIKKLRRRLEDFRQEDANSDVASSCLSDVEERDYSGTEHEEDQTLPKIPKHRLKNSKKQNMATDDIKTQQIELRTANPVQNPSASKPQETEDLSQQRGGESAKSDDEAERPTSPSSTWRSPVNEPQPSLTGTARVLGHRPSPSRLGKMKIAMLGKDSDDEEAEEALANTKRSAVAVSVETPHSKTVNSPEAKEANDSENSDANSYQSEKSTDKKNPDDTLDF